MIGYDITGKRGLAIVEKPSLLRTIEQVYNLHRSEIPYEITFMAQRGHLLELLSPDAANEEYKSWNWENLPITKEKLGGWKYQVKNEKRVGNFLTSKERFDQIAKALNSGEHDFVINIGDPDREGQLLVDLTLEKLGNTLPVMRYWQNATTEEKILKCLLNLRSNQESFFQNTLSAAKARQHLDYLVGMNLSRAASMKMNTRVSSGRVKNVVLDLICRRELEIKNFKPETIYGIKSVYDLGFEGAYFVGTGSSSENEEDKVDSGVVWFKTKQEASEFIDNTSKIGVVSEYKAKKTEKYAGKFLKMSTLQYEAGKQLGMNTIEAATCAQSLYEAQLITYHRSTCEYIDSSEDLRSYLVTLASVEELSPYVRSVTPDSIKRVYGDKKWVNDSKVDTSGHTGIIPTNKVPDFSKMSTPEKNLYLLIARTFLAAFLPPLVQNNVEIVVTVDGEKTFKSSGKTLISPGYTELFSRNFIDVELPVLKKGDSIKIDSFKIAEKTSSCPKRYTSGELVMVCENPVKYLEDEAIKAELKKLNKKLLIGTPATLSNANKTGILDKLVTVDKYATLKKEGKREVFVPTDFGMMVNANLAAIDFPLRKIDVTGQWEVTLENIIAGDRTYEDFMAEMSESIEDMINSVKNAKMEQAISRNGIEKIATCPRCGGDILQTEKAFFCSNYKDNGCMSGGFRNRGGHVLSAIEFKQLLDGQEIVVDAVFEEKDEKGKVISKRKYKQRVGLDEKGTITNLKAKVNVTNYTCPACQKRILENENGYSCEGRLDESCSVYLGKEVGGVSIASENVNLIFSGKESDIITGLKTNPKPGKPSRKYDAILYVDNESRKIGMKFPEATYHCPLCQNKLDKQGIKLECSSCGFNMWLKQGQVFLTDSELKDLFGKKITKVRKMQKKDGSTFEAMIAIDVANKTTKFEFPKRG